MKAPLTLKLCVLFSMMIIGCPRPTPVPPVVDDADTGPPVVDGTKGDAFCRVLAGAGCAEGKSSKCAGAVDHALDSKISQRITDDVAACLARLPSPATPAQVQACETDCTFP